MTKFSEVTKQWKRMCIAHGNDYGKCDNCPLGEKRICAFEISDIDDDEFERVEAAVMAWAAEHPVPVYPTWYEYFRSIGMGSATGGYVADWVLTTRIPADIAEKLGIKPEVRDVT